MAKKMTPIARVNNLAVVMVFGSIVKMDGDASDSSKVEFELAARWALGGAGLTRVTLGQVLYQR